MHENTLNTFVGAIDEYYKNMMKVLHSKMDAARKGYPTQFHVRISLYNLLCMTVV